MTAETALILVLLVIAGVIGMLFLLDAYEREE